MTIGIRGGFRNPLVDGALILEGSIGSSALADGAVTTQKLADLAVAAAKLADSSVTATKIANLAVGTAAIANLAVTNAKIDDLAVTNAKIASLSADKITAGTINTTEITIQSTLTMGVGGLIRTAASGRRVEIQDSGGFGGIHFYGGSGSEPGSVVTINAEEMQIVAPVDDSVTHEYAILRLQSENALGFTAGFIFGKDGAALDTWANIDNGGIWMGSSSGSVSVTTTRHVLNPSGWAWHTRSGGTPLFVQRTTSAGQLVSFMVDTTLTGELYASTANRLRFRAIGGPQIESLGDTKDLIFYDSTGVNVGFWDDSITSWRFFPGGTGVTESLRLTNGGAGSSVFMRDGLTDVGNHETLRLNRGTGTTLQAVGYYSSHRAQKREIVPLAQSKLWNREWYDDLRPVKYRRRSTQQREFGFIIEDLAEIGSGLGRFLTTKGEQVGDSPDEIALLAVTVDAVIDLRARVRELESRLERLEKA